VSGKQKRDRFPFLSESCKNTQKQEKRIFFTIRRRNPRCLLHPADSLVAALPVAQPQVVAHTAMH
jgi:hypothetical protein